jgi:hypothetical protein
MAINYIDVGIIANDGTGDDLREAFIKVNDNFEELDLRIVEETVIVSGGSLGVPVYAGKINGENVFKRLVAGANVSLASTDNTITINSENSLDQLIIVSDSGTITISRGQSLSIKGGEGINTRQSLINSQEVTISLDTTGIVSQDTAPLLSANLDANNKNIINANEISAATFNGNLEGNVYGYDVRSFLDLYNDFDFGQFYPVYSTPIAFIIRNLDVDFGAFDPRKPDEVDFGGF